MKTQNTTPKKRGRKPWKRQPVVLLRIGHLHKWTNASVPSWLNA